MIQQKPTALCCYLQMLQWYLPVLPTFAMHMCWSGIHCYFLPCVAKSLFCSSPEQAHCQYSLSVLKLHFRSCRCYRGNSWQLLFSRGNWFAAAGRWWLHITREGGRGVLVVKARLWPLYSSQLAGILLWWLFIPPFGYSISDTEKGAPVA